MIAILIKSIPNVAGASKLVCNHDSPVSFQDHSIDAAHRNHQATLPVRPIIASEAQTTTREPDLDYMKAK